MANGCFFATASKCSAMSAPTSAEPPACGHNVALYAPPPVLTPGGHSQRARFKESAAPPPLENNSSGAPRSPIITPAPARAVPWRMPVVAVTPHARQSVVLPAPGAPQVHSLRSFTGELPPAAQTGRWPRPSLSASLRWPPERALRASGALLRPAGRALRADAAAGVLRLRRAGRAEPRNGPPAPRRRQGCRPLFVALPALRAPVLLTPALPLRGFAISALSRSVVAAGDRPSPAQSPLRLRPKSNAHHLRAFLTVAKFAPEHRCS